MRLVTVALIGLLSTSVFAKLPPATEEAKAKATEANAKANWIDKVGQYQLCLSMDRAAENYRKNTEAAGKPVPVPVATPSCTDPGLFASELTPPASKPLEAAGAHSPPGIAVSPPSRKATASEIAIGVKK